MFALVVAVAVALLELRRLGTAAGAVDLHSDGVLGTEAHV
jgi:hypothetical protein